LKEIVEIARSHSIIVFSDEVYRPLFHSISPAEMPPSILSLGYENTIATSSLSKAYSAAGLRIGWIASQNSKIIELCVNARSYALITTSQVDEHLACFIMSSSCENALIEANRALAQQNVDIVQSFIDQNSSTCQWVKPIGASIGFIKFTRNGQPVNDLELCTRLFEQKGLLLVPGQSCFGDGVSFPGYVRLGFGGDTLQLEAGLEAIQSFLRSDYNEVPLST
jgi:aspartate/methionine/tyrosine aminotransferase